MECLILSTESVSRYNKEKLQARVRNGPNKHPGANFIRMGDGFVRSLAFGDREKIAKSLRYGDVVERHMEDGDVVLFNHQPSLHKVSIIAHKAKIMEWRTFRFNTCVCAPYNPDFDGDEMNVHFPQTEEARTEAIMLMGVHNNLTTTCNGEPLVAASQDFLTASYLLTQNEGFFTFEQFCSVVTYFGESDEHIDVPAPTILKPIRLWTVSLPIPFTAGSLQQNFFSCNGVSNYFSKKGALLVEKIPVLILCVHSLSAVAKDCWTLLSRRLRQGIWLVVS
jgi:DNA-directed RNA polymerase III subunit RPC1